MIKQSTKRATVEAVLKRGHVNKDGKHPVKIRVTYDRVQKFYPVLVDGKPLYMSVADFDGRKKSRRAEIRALSDQIDRVERSAALARDKITHGRPFTWERFESEFLLDESGKGFLSAFAEHLESIRAEGRIGTYKAYNNAFQAFKAFRKGRELSPYDITAKLLKEFEASLVKRGCGKTTIGMYARALKVIYNLMADENRELLEGYPFARKQTDRNRYKIKTGSGHKGDALTIEQLQKLIALKVDPLLPTHEEARLLWLFSFHCHGMNLKDICLLKYRDIQGETIRYVREKTKDTEASETVMEIPLTDPIREIIARIGNPDKRPTSYVFPIIPNGLASLVKRRTDRAKTEAERIDEIVRQKIKMVNARLKWLCEQNDLPPITTYWARHSFANLLKESGESVEVIREMLGHSDIRTTEAYLKRFDLAKKKAVSDKIRNLLTA